MKSSLTKLAAILALVALAIVARLLTPDAQGTDLVDPLGLSFDRPTNALLETGTALGVLLLGAWLLGKVLANFGFSKITGYLVFGILAGPGIGAWIVGEDGTWLISKDQQNNLQLVNDLAIALIALTAGGEIRLSYVRKAFRSISLILTFEFTLVLIVVGALMTVLLNGSGALAEYGGLTTVILVATVIAVVATANSPCRGHGPAQ